MYILLNFRVSNNLYEGITIVDITYIFSQIQRINSKMHTSGLGCSFINVELINEIRRGFETTWIFKCKRCNLLTPIESEIKNLEYVPINNGTN